MPYPIWCTTCTKPTIIGQGVRFNAEKKKVGNYFSTPIFSFRMKHTACGGWIEIRTDPKNTAYVVTEGAKKRDTGEDKVHEGEIVLRTDEERERLQNDAFAALEVKVGDKRQAATDKGRIEELLDAGDKDWDDPYAASRRLRKSFRVERKVREKKLALTEGLKDRMSLGMDLLPETEEDRRRAGFVEFGNLGAAGSEVAIINARAKPLFSTEPINGKGRSSSERKSERPKAKQAAERQREALRLELQQNTRAIMDPFLADQAVFVTTGPILGIKRKRTQSEDEEKQQQDIAPGIDVFKPPLVDYDSD
ncbi:hypothetical protein MMC18_006123 [Xylographa bjoerkii]|nr:hypothetical protein [Xylographa bjoerkii]